MLFTLLYHRVYKNTPVAFSNSYEKMVSHLSWIKDNYKTLLPGEKILQGKLQVCLTFDDGYVDFYDYVFPLLKQFHLKAVLAVCPGLIENSAYHKKPIKFCSWAQLEEMAKSGLVEIACHSYSHTPLTRLDVDLQLEIVKAKALLTERLMIPINTFVYPYGNYNQEVHTKVKQHYDYIMRIGNALNFSWGGKRKLIYRIPCDNLFSHQAPFDNLLLPLLKWGSNRLRGK